MAAAATVTENGGLDVFVNGEIQVEITEASPVGDAELFDEMRRSTFGMNKFCSVRVIHEFVPLLQAVTTCHGYPDLMSGQEGESFYDAPGVHERYTAHREDRRLNPNHVMEEPAILAEMGDPAGLRVLDLGCGDGAFGRWLLAAGARSYLGVDSSTKMVEQARRTLAGMAGRVDLADIENFVAGPDAVDLVTARLSIHYVADLDRVFATCARALAPAGRLLVTVVHPVITSYHNHSAGPRTTWTVDDYFNPGPRIRGWMGSQVTWYHRTIEAYFAAVTGAGLTVTSIRECEPDSARFAGDTEELSRRRRVPLFLLLNAKTPGPVR